MARLALKITKSGRILLYLISWRGIKQMIPDDMEKELDFLRRYGLVEATHGGYLATERGVNLLSETARKALQRPTNYFELSEKEKWQVDKDLGVLDWDGV